VKLIVAHYHFTSKNATKRCSQSKATTNEPFANAAVKPVVLRPESEPPVGKDQRKGSAHARSEAHICQSDVCPQHFRKQGCVIIMEDRHVRLRAGALPQGLRRRIDLLDGSS
jgi:hypothetical protein